MVDIRVQKREGAVAWRQDIKKMEKDMRITVDEGCEAIAFAGGTRLGEFHGGNVSMLNESGRMQKQYKNVDFFFLVCNRKQPVTVKWGVGKNPVSYQDSKLEGAMISVSAYGHCEVEVHNVVKLWNSLSDEVTGDYIVENDEIAARIQREIISRVGPIIAQKLSEEGDYTKVLGSIPKLNRAILDKLNGLEMMGLHLTKVVIEGLDFTEQSKEFIALAQERAKSKIAQGIVEAQAEQIQSIIKAVDSKKEGN